MTSRRALRRPSHTVRGLSARLLHDGLGVTDPVALADAAAASGDDDTVLASGILTGNSYTS
jgi:hypothetical protein